MPILVMCSNPECGELFDAPDEAANTEVPCPACGKVQLLGQTATPAGDTSPPEKPARIEPQESSTPTETEAKEKDTEELDLGPLQFAEDEDTLLPPQGDTADDFDSIAHAIGLTPEPDEHASAYEYLKDPGTSDIKVEGDKEAFDDMPPLPPEEWSMAEGAFEDEEIGVLEHRIAAPILFTIGLLGMSAGLVAGVMSFALHPVLGAYAGASVGWIAGFVFAFLVVLAADREHPDKVRCALCRNVFPAGTATCRFCGSSLLEADFPTLTVSCMRVGPYALSNLTSVYWLSMLVVGGYLLYVGAGYLLQEFPGQVGPWELPLFGFCGIIGLLILAGWVQFFVRAIAGTLFEHDKAPDVLKHLGVKDMLVGFTGLGAVALYVAPILTMPLFPLGLISLSASQKGEAFDLLRSAKTAWRQAKNYANLWLLMLLWVAGSAFAVSLAWMGFGLIKDLVDPIADVSSKELLLVVLNAAKVGFCSAIVCIFGLAVSRCIGLFGRQNAALFRRGEAPGPAPMTGGGN